MGYGYYGIDMSYIVLVMPAILFSLWAQTKVNSTFSKYQRVRCYSGYTGAQIARRILDENGLSNVRVERVSGSLTDHYDPRTHVVRLSDSVYNSDSVAAVGVAAHETGHAVQHATGYGPLGLRNAIIPITNFGSKLSMPLILMGLILNSYTLAMTGIIAFSMVALFQLITLPVELTPAEERCAPSPMACFPTESLAARVRCLPLRRSPMSLHCWYRQCSCFVCCCL